MKQNGKYWNALRTIFSPMIYLFTLIFGLFNDRFYDHPALGVKFGIIAMILASIGVIEYMILDEKLPVA